jgi:hypothetical protein
MGEVGNRGKGWLAMSERRTGESNGAEERTRTSTPLRAQAPEGVRVSGRSQPTSVKRGRLFHSMSDRGESRSRFPESVAHRLHRTHLALTVHIGPQSAGSRTFNRRTISDKDGGSVHHVSAIDFCRPHSRGSGCTGPVRRDMARPPAQVGGLDDTPALRSSGTARAADGVDAKAAAASATCAWPW